jgi:histidinol-phosphate phosphatase family protein
MKAIFLDRDGVICHDRPGYVKNWDEFQFIPGALGALSRLASQSLAFVVVTNQSVINRGIVPSSIVDDLHGRMLRTVAESGGRIDRVYVCPHRPDEGCGCRKPQTGLLLRAKHELGIDLGASYLVGDAWTDVQAGLTAGCRVLLVLTGRGRQQVDLIPRMLCNRVLIVQDLGEAVAAISACEGRSIHWRPAPTCSWPSRALSETAESPV